MRLLRRRVDTSVEDQILTGLIVSTPFCKDLFPILNPDYFQTDHARTIIKWTKDYFDRYKKCPDRSIEEIYRHSKKDLKEADAENVGLFLEKISGQYEESEHFNVDFYMDRALEYFRGQAVRLVADKSRVLLDTGHLDEAEEVVRDYKKVAKDVSGWVDPFDPVYIRKVLLDRLDKDILFSFPGALGKVVGPLERRWLVGILGPMKRGKTWYLQECAVQALFERLKVVFVSLEMDDLKISRRIYKRLTAFGDEEKDYPYPVFDCKRNQDDSCTLSQRVNNIRLLMKDGEKPHFSPAMKYRVCAECRGNRTRFVPEAWFTLSHRQKLKIKSVTKHLEGLQGMMGDHLRILPYPAYSANIGRVKRDLEKLEYTEGFVPDVIVIDYADILAPEDARQVGRERTDETWKMLKNLSQSKHCLVITASQSNRASISKKNVTQEDTAEDIRKIAHVEVMMSLNQLPKEKKGGIMRLAVIAHREKDFEQLRQCMVLQQMELGQVLLDSELIDNYKEIQEMREKIQEAQIFS
jgi:hypothetical protein